MAAEKEGSPNFANSGKLKYVKKDLLHSTALVNSPGTPIDSPEAARGEWMISAVKPVKPEDSLFSTPEMSRYVDDKEILDIIEAEFRVHVDANLSAQRRENTFSSHLTACNRMDSFLGHTLLNPPLPHNLLFSSTPNAGCVKAVPKVLFSNRKQVPRDSGKEKSTVGDNIYPDSKDENSLKSTTRIISVPVLPPSNIENQECSEARCMAATPPCDIEQWLLTHRNTCKS